MQTRISTPQDFGAQSDVLQGWRLLGVTSAALVVMALVILALDPTVDGVRRVIRATARTSLLLFGAAFVASAVWKLFPGPLTRWQRQNRRYLGLGFAISHTIHAVAIASFATLDPISFKSASNLGSLISGGIAYGFILLMTLTSFDRTASWIGDRAWKVLHKFGVYYLWISFMITFGKRLPVSPAYWIPLVFLVVILGIRIWGGCSSSTRNVRHAAS